MTGLLEGKAFEELMLLRTPISANKTSGQTPIDDEIEMSAADPVLPTRFKLGETTAAIQLAIGVAVNDLWQLRTGTRQHLSVSAVHAAASLRSFELLKLYDVADDPQWAARNARAQISNPHPTADGKFFLPHMGLPHLGQRILDILDCEYALAPVKQALLRWQAQELDDAVAKAKGCGAIVRTQDEWLAHPQGRFLASQPVIEIEKIGDSQPEMISSKYGEARPLQGARVLDLTRILAGPTCARTLSEHGADVLMVTEKSLPQVDRFVKDTCHGKRSCFLDLADARDANTLIDLVKEADVFSQGYRPGVMDRLGFSPVDLAKIRPGIIYTSMNCYGFGGPFEDRAGWEQLAQTVTGIAAEEDGDIPRLLPAAACDYMTGYLAAYGTLLALRLRAEFGGSYHVKASLCQSAMFLQRQARVDVPVDLLPLASLDLSDVLVETQTGHGRVQHLSPILKMSDTQPHWTLPTPVLGEHAPVWL